MFDPKPAGGRCKRAKGYQAPASELPGQQTFVENPDGTQETTHEKEQVLPSPPWSKSKPLPHGGRPQYNNPGESGSAPDGRSIHKDKARTLGAPGGDDDHPYVDNASQGYKQRRDMTSAIDGPRFPGTNKQHAEKGKARTYYRKRYRENRTEMKMRSKKWYAVKKKQVKVKRDRKLRREHPEKFERFQGGGATSIAQRDEKSRRENKLRFEKEALLQLLPQPSAILLADDQEAWLLGLDLDLEVAHIELNDMPIQIPLETFLDELIVENEEELDPLFEYLDAQFDYSEARTADFLYEKRPPDMPSDQKFDRGKPALRWPGHNPSENTGPDYQIEDNPGSGRVIPYNKDFVNNKAAFLISEIFESCNPDLQKKALKVSVKLKKVDAKNSMWTFEVKGSKENYKVRIKASPKGNIRDLGKLDVVVSCSCPFWQWQGPEHHATQKGYLYGKPVGTAAAPEVKDPEGTHGACKHVLAVLKQVSTYSLPVNRGKVASVECISEESMSTQVVAARYIERKGGF